MTSGASDRLLLKGTVVAPGGPMLGEVLVEGAVITCVAASCSSETGALGATVIDTHGVILPGLIDAHDHGLFSVFDETDWSPSLPYSNHNQWTAETRYAAMVDAKQYLAGEGTGPVDLTCELDKYAEVKALIAGTTSFLLADTARTCFGSLARTIDTQFNDLPADKVRTSISVPSSTGAQTVCNDFTAGGTDAYVVHVAEGTDASARNEFATLSTRVNGCLLSAKTTIVHGTALTATEFSTMATAGMSLIWSPKSNVFLYGATTDIPAALAAGLQTIAVAPDWALGGSVNMLDELRFADAFDNAHFGNVLTPERLFRMATIDAARALHVDQYVGSLEVGKRADIAVIPASDSNVYASLLQASPANVRLVMVNGRVLYGDKAVEAVGPTVPGCERLMVCGTEKFLCVAANDSSNKLSQTLVEVKTAIEAALTDYDATSGAQAFMPLAPLTKCP